MGWFGRLRGNQSTTPDLPHQVPDLEATLPDAIAGRPLRRWSVVGKALWRVLGVDPVRSGWTEEFRTLGVSTDAIAMAVTGRSDARQDPPYISWAVRFGKLEGPALTSPAPSSLAMAVMTVDPNQGANWIVKSIAGKAVLVGHPGMVRQDDHHRGLPVVHVGRTAIYAVIAEDDAWIEEVIAGLPA